MKKEVIKNICKIHIPENIYTFGALTMFCTPITSILSTDMESKRYKALWQATGDRYYEIRYMQLIHTNNWLRMHGYPMCRRYK